MFPLWHHSLRRCAAAGEHLLHRCHRLRFETMEVGSFGSAFANAVDVCCRYCCYPERLFHVLQDAFEKLMVSWKKWGGRCVSLHGRSDGEWRAWLSLSPASHRYLIPMVNRGQLIRNSIQFRWTALIIYVKFLFRKKSADAATWDRTLIVAHFTFYLPRCVIIYILSFQGLKRAFQAVYGRKCPLTSRSVVRMSTILNGGTSSFKWPSELAGQTHPHLEWNAP